MTPPLSDKIIQELLEIVDKAKDLRQCALSADVLKSLLLEVKEARSVIGFYADKNNWEERWQDNGGDGDNDGDIGDVIQQSDVDPFDGENLKFGGVLARAHMTKFSGGNE